MIKTRISSGEKDEKKAVSKQVNQPEANKTANCLI
jgi:hypothetical protein